jgi:5'-deoxynucleotidase YfbR-like HD superfamily hydrolase
MKISEIYQKYQIPPHLQLHMYRVSAVAWTICDNFDEELDKINIVAAELLHDMGNIIKFDLKLFPEFLEPEGYDYWERVQKDYIARYGYDEHEATRIIANEVSTAPRIQELLNSVGSSKTSLIIKSKDKAKWIANYSDYRVYPHGVVSLKRRLEDGRKRYVNNTRLNSVSMEKSIEIEKFSYELEELIQKETSIDLNSITDESVSDIIKQLPNFEIETL